MNELNVLVVSGEDLADDFLEKISHVDPRISLKVAIRQFIEELRVRGDRRSVMERLGKEANKRGVPQLTQGQESLDDLLAQADVVYGRLLFPDNMLKRAPRLKWIHIQGAGLDGHRSTGIFESEVIITSGRGTMATAMAEHTLALILMLAKKAPSWLANKQMKRWERFETMDIQDRTVGIIGFGAVGKEIARLAGNVGMRILAMDKLVMKREKNVLGVDEVFPITGLHEIISESDFLVIAAPLTAETEGMIGKRELQVMKPTAYLINVARGAILNQSDLIAAVKERSIAGAGLDVFETEPLPSDSELWDLPNVILSCHMAGSTSNSRNRDIDLFCENLRRYLAGSQLLNVVK